MITNQSEKKVYFNNLILVLKRGNIVQSNDYYPFGLTWENPKDDLHTYQGKELQRNEWSSGGLDMLDFSPRDHYVAARMYNPLIGRWHNPDPMNQFDSPYNAMLSNSWSERSEDLEMPIPLNTGGNNPVINIDPDGMWSLPWGGIMGSVGSIISNMTTTHIVSPRDMSISTEYSFGHGFGEALQVAGAGLAFWEGGKMLSDGLFNLGDNAVRNNLPSVGRLGLANRTNVPFFTSTSFTYAQFSRTQIGGDVPLKLNKDFGYVSINAIHQGFSTSESRLFNEFKLSEPSGLMLSQWGISESSSNFGITLGAFRNHTKGGMKMPDGNYVHFSKGNSQVGVGIGTGYQAISVSGFSLFGSAFVGGGPQFTGLGGKTPNWGIRGWGVIGNGSIGVSTPWLGRFAGTLSGNMLVHSAKMKPFINANEFGVTKSYSSVAFTTISPLFFTFSLNYSLIR